MTIDISVTGAKEAVHSGDYGGIVYEPMLELVKVLASLRNKSADIISSTSK